MYEEALGALNTILPYNMQMKLVKEADEPKTERKMELWFRELSNSMPENDREIWTVFKKGTAGVRYYRVFFGLPPLARLLPDHSLPPVRSWKVSLHELVQGQLEAGCAQRAGGQRDQERNDGVPRDACHSDR